MSEMNKLNESMANLWKKDVSASSASMNSSKNVSNQRLATSSNYEKKTPPKSRGLEHFKIWQTPSKTPSKRIKSKRIPFETQAGGDRFIPSRSNTNFEMAHFMIAQRNKQAEGKENVVTAKEAEMGRLVGNALGNVPSSRLLVYNNNANNNKKPLEIVCPPAHSPSSDKDSRIIPQTAERILDAPDLWNDFYLNLLDWNSENIVAIGLGTKVYLWNSVSGGVKQLLDLGDSNYVCSVKWVPQGSLLAVGTTQATIELWDCSRMKRLRIMTGHTGRVGALSWNNFVLSSGSRMGHIMHSDVRQREHTLSIVGAHSHEICGLTWSPDGKYLASGGNDNILNVWAVVPGQYHAESTPLHTFNTHVAAVKAVAWCPWAPHILASGAGTADRCINIWNVRTGTLMSSTDTQSQVCALVWAPEYKELVSGHGYADNQLTIWKFPSMKKQAELLGHSERILQLVLSADGTTVLSAGADETLRLWKCFVPNPAKKKALFSNATSSILRPSIR